MAIYKSYCCKHKSYIKLQCKRYNLKLKILELCTMKQLAYMYMVLLSNDHHTFVLRILAPNVQLDLLIRTEACIEVPINFNEFAQQKLMSSKPFHTQNPSHNETEPVETGPICKYSSTLNLPLAFYET